MITPLSVCFCLFDLILCVPSTIFQLNRDGSSWVEPVLSKDKCVLLKDHNAVTPVWLEPAAPQSRVKHSTTEPLHSLYTFICDWCLYHISVSFMLLLKGINSQYYTVLCLGHGITRLLCFYNQCSLKANMNAFYKCLVEYLF